MRNTLRTVIQNIEHWVIALIERANNKELREKKSLLNLQI